MLRKLKALRSMNAKLMAGYAEAFIHLGWARLQLAITPFAKLAPMLGSGMEETAEEANPEHLAALVHVNNTIEAMSRHTPWESKCFVQAIAGMNMLARRRIDCTLYLGTARDERGKMIAHAWLRSGPYYVTGANGAEKFTVVGKFAKRVRTG
ncbi:lasso peptide biosynthesis B2 protein [Paenibacillus chartarius]|uniref:Lasso peptide biosynthesis B2 protein n=1 Tax=Paenibacillus chartarius TaxID=747481 RepID=A0ABV6DV94_9BACL